MTIVTKKILIQGDSGQTVDEALSIMHDTCTIPRPGTNAILEKKIHEIHGDYLEKVTSPWGGLSPEIILTGVTLDVVEIEIEELGI